MYPECMAYDFERFREETARILRKNEARLVLDLPSEKQMQEGVLYFDLNRWKGRGRFSDENKARKGVLDFLSDIRNLFSGCFSLATMACKEVGESEKYRLFFLNPESKPVTVLRSHLTKEGSEARTEIELPDVSGWIQEYRNLLSTSACIPADSFPVSVGLVILNEEKATVGKYSEEVYALLKEKYTVEILHAARNYREEENRWLETGIPLIVEIGRIAAKKNQVILVGRERREPVPLESVMHEIERIDRLRRESFLDASFRRNAAWSENKTEFASLRPGNRFCCCLNPDCLNRIQTEKGFEIIAQPFSNRLFSEVCVVCKGKAKTCLFGLAKK